MAYQYGGKMRSTTTLGNNSLYLGLYLRLNLCGGCFTIYYLPKRVFLNGKRKTIHPLRRFAPRPTCLRGTVSYNH